MSQKDDFENNQKAEAEKLMSRWKILNYYKMKKDVLNRVKGAILTKDEAKTISGGYTGGSFIDGSPCSFIICGAPENRGSSIATPSGCTPRNLYIYKPNPSLYCVVL